MNLKKFELCVKLEAPGLQAEAIRHAVDHHADVERLEPRHVSECVKLARRRNSEVGPIEAGSGSRVDQQARDEIRLVNQQLGKAAAPHVLALRRKLFDRERPRFQTHEAAIRWIESAPHPDLSEPSLVLTYAKASPPKKRRGGAMVIYGPERRLVAEHSTHGQFAVAVAEFHENFGYRETVLIEHVLTGTPLILPPFRIRDRKQWNQLPDGSTLYRPTAQIEVLIPSAFVGSVVKAAVSRIQRALHPEGRPPSLNERESLVRSLVEQAGGLPLTRGDFEPFWERIKGQYNKHRPTGAPPFSVWNSAMMCYRRGEEKLRGRSS